MRGLWVVLVLMMVGACANSENSGSTGTSSGNPANATQTERTMRMAERAMAEGKPELAAMFYRTAALADPQNPKPRAASAVLFERGGEYSAAAALFQQLAQEQKSHDYWLSAGRNYLKANQVPQAISAYEAVLEKKPQDPRALNGLGVSYDLQQEHARAQEWYGKAFAEADNEMKRGVAINWALSLMLAGKAGEAVQKLQALDAAESTPSMRQTLALAYGLSGQTSQAEALGLKNPPTYDELRAAIRDHGMGGIGGGMSSGSDGAMPAVPAGEVVTVPVKKP